VNQSNNTNIEKLLVFDLDETLVHCIFNDKDIFDADVFLDISMPNGKSARTGFNIRPYWKEMMDDIQEDWEIVVFTASCKNYADTILDYLDPDNKYFPHRFYRETCWKTPEGVYIKDLRVFHQWKLEDIILVDNAVYSFGFQLDNGIPIFPYYKGKDDKQLLYLKEYLKLIANKDLLKDLKKTFKMTELYSCDIDSFLDYYGGDEDSDDNPNDILDQMVKNKNFFREKSQSFNHGLFTCNRHRFSTEGILHSNGTDKGEDKKSEPSVIKLEEVPRSHSSTLAIETFNAFVEPCDLEADLLNPSYDISSSESKPKAKKKRTKMTMLKKHQSVYNKTEPKLEARL
jgi:CTD small phosphatase-like protein 2